MPSSTFAEVLPSVLEAVCEVVFHDLLGFCFCLPFSSQDHEARLWKDEIECFGFVDRLLNHCMDGWFECFFDPFSD